MTRIDRYAVTGHPVAHSLSPRIHLEFAAQTGEQLEYGLLDLSADQFAGGVREFFETGGCGLNVTVPHKERAFQLADQVSMSARVAGAVNTLSRSKEGLVVGDTTDGAGLLHDLEVNIGLSLNGLRVLVIGAGGTARSILLPLLGARPESVAIANRNSSKAKRLAQIFAGIGPVTPVALRSLEHQRFDLIVNATSASLHGELPAELPKCVEGAHCYDVMYAKRGTVFSHWAIAHGAAAAHTGVGMLVEQAAESFLLWRGIRPETGDVLAELYSDLKLIETRDA